MKNYEKINIENIEEDDDDFEENYEYNDEIEEINEDNYPSNEGIINNLKKTFMRMKNIMLLMKKNR